MKQIFKTSEFSTEHWITGFSEKTYEASIKYAEEWAKRNNIELVAYFEQPIFGKSILVSYKKENKNAGNMVIS
jgi:hypothetical protein